VAIGMFHVEHSVDFSKFGFNTEGAAHYAFGGTRTVPPWAVSGFVDYRQNPCTDHQLSDVPRETIRTDALRVGVKEYFPHDAISPLKRIGVRKIGSQRRATPAEAPPSSTADHDVAPDVAKQVLPDQPVKRRPYPRVIAIANQKGGVGKTTTAVNLGAALADLGHRVLLIDLDPQGNATTGVGIDARNFDNSMYDVLLHDVPLEDCIEPTSIKNLFVAPSTLDLAGAEIELVPAFSRELRLRRAVEQVKNDFSFVLMDCPPSLGLITVNGLAAAAELLVPIQCEYYALEGLAALLKNVELIKGNLNPVLEVSHIVLTMYDGRTRLADQVVAEVRSHFGATVCRTIIPRSVRISEAPSFGAPVTVHDPSSRGSIAYRELAKEVSNVPS